MLTYINPKRAVWDNLTKRPNQNNANQRELVEQVFDEVKFSGDNAVRKYTHFFDKADIDSFEVPKKDLENAEQRIDTKLKKAIDVAFSNITKFHTKPEESAQFVETTEQVVCWQENRAISKVGLYIPGGTAPLFSTVLMLAIPAKIATCEEIVLCSPPNRKGEIDPTILYAANLCGVEKVYKVGGIQAIAALTFGTESIPAVYKVFGPGNSYVTVAKQLAQNYGLAIDMPAGPSEVLVWVDESCNALWSAIDLLSQAEHGEDSQVVCVSNNVHNLSEIKREIEVLLPKLERKEIILKSLQNAVFIVLDSEQCQLDFINAYAPEHLIIQTCEPEKNIPKIQNAGSVFIGNYSPESAGDYASGTNHTLPTSGFSKAYSGITVDAFRKKISFQKLSKSGLRNLGDTIETMALAEGLQAHQMAVQLRLEPEKTEEL